MLDKLRQLENNVSELRQIREEIKSGVYKNTKRMQWSIRYGIFESIQIVIDISCHIVSKYNLGNPKTYKDCLIYLSKNGYIGEELYTKINGMVGLRNILVHEYATINDENLIKLLEEIDDFTRFSIAIEKLL